MELVLLKAEYCWSLEVDLLLSASNLMYQLNLYQLNRNFDCKLYCIINLSEQYKGGFHIVA